VVIVASRRGERYGLTEDGIGWMLQAQSGRCWLCCRWLALSAPIYADGPLHFFQSPPVGWRGYEHFHIDHCHECGEVRRLLCPGCNTELAWVEYGSAGCYPKRALDPVWVAAAEAYLAAHACSGRWSE
jgi:Recombination endonuclease VII